MPLSEDASNTNATAVAHLKAGGQPCIGVKLVNKDGDTPAHIEFSENTTNKDKGVCKQVIESEPVAAYFNSKVGGTAKKMAVGSSKGVYKSAS